MKNLKKIVSILCVLSITGALFAGCQQSNSSTKTTEQQGSTSKGDPKEEVTLRFSWWGGEARHEGTLDAIDLYMEKNPNIKINAEYGGWDGYYQKLVTQLAGGTAPDIMQVDQPWLADLTAQGEMFKDLNELKTVIKLDGFDQKFLEDYATVDGKLEGLPTGINGLAMVLNKTLLESNNIDISGANDWTWDDLVEAGKALHEKNENAYLFNADTGVYTYMILRTYVRQQTGNQWVNDDYTVGFDKDTLVRGLGYLKQLQEEQIAQPFEEAILFEGKPEQNPKWINNELGAIINWPSIIPVLRSDDFELEVARVPVAEDAKTSAIVTRPTQILTISNQTDHPQEAAEFLNWLLNDKEAVLTLGDIRGIPAVDSARTTLLEANKLDENISKAVDIALKNSGEPENGISSNGELDEITEEITHKVLYGKSTPEAAAEEMIARFEEKLQELKAARE